MRPPDAAGRSFFQLVFQISRLVGQRASYLNMFEGAPGGSVRLPLPMLTPGQIIKRPATVSDSPMRHDTLRIEFEPLPKTLYPLSLVDPKTPVQAEIEPALCLGRCRGEGPRVVAKVEAIHSL